MNRILDLFLTFLKIGGFTFGGGYAMIPLIEREICENKKWLDSKDILEVIAVAESTPGPIAINAATFVGYRTAGVLGAAAATFGVVLPSFVIIALISAVLQRFQEIRAVKYAFFGIRACIPALILKAVWSMFKASPKGVFEFLIMAAALILAAFVKFDAVYIIIGCAVFGLIHSFLAERRHKDDNS